MKAEFIEYLYSIGLTETFIKKILPIYEFYKMLSPCEITDLFVTDYIKEDGTREYENLWFFSSDYCGEAKLFLIKENFDMTPLRQGISYWRIEKQDYDFVKATDSSRLVLYFNLRNLISGDLKASKGNCDHLKDIILKYITPNLMH